MQWFFQLVREVQWWCEELWDEVRRDLQPRPPPTMELSCYEGHVERWERGWVIPLPFRISYSVDEPQAQLSLSALDLLGRQLRDPLDRRSARDGGLVVGGWTHLLNQPDELEHLTPEVRLLVARLAEREQKDWH